MEWTPFHVKRRKGFELSWEGRTRKAGASGACVSRETGIGPPAPFGELDQQILEIARGDSWNSPRLGQSHRPDRGELFTRLERKRSETPIGSIGRKFDRFHAVESHGPSPLALQIAGILQLNLRPFQGRIRKDRDRLPGQQIPIMNARPPKERRKPDRFLDRSRLIERQQVIYRLRARRMFPLPRRVRGPAPPVPCSPCSLQRPSADRAAWQARTAVAARCPDVGVVETPLET